MEASNLGCCKLSWGKVSKNLITSHRRHGGMVRTRCQVDDGWGRLVDESMIGLRLRIKEMKMLEANEDNKAPSHWMEWEKQYYYAHYDQDVFQAIGLLQSFFMGLRPSVALGLLLLVALSVLICSGVGFLHAMEIAKRFLSCFDIAK